MIIFFGLVCAILVSITNAKMYGVGGPSEYGQDLGVVSIDSDGTATKIVDVSETSSWLGTSGRVGESLFWFGLRKESSESNLTLSWWSAENPSLVSHKVTPVLVLGEGILPATVFSVAGVANGNKQQVLIAGKVRSTAVSGTLTTTLEQHSEFVALPPFSELAADIGPTGIAFGNQADNWVGFGVGLPIGMRFLRGANLRRSVATNCSFATRIPGGSVLGFVFGPSWNDAQVRSLQPPAKETIVCEKLSGLSSLSVSIIPVSLAYDTSSSRLALQLMSGIIFIDPKQCSASFVSTTFADGTPAYMIASAAGFSN